jgi:peptide/nickel transport system permease protein
MILGQDATPEQVAELNARLGYDKPFIVRYLRYMGDIVRGDMGRSYRTNHSVFEEISVRFPITIQLSILIMTIAVCIALPIGVLSAVRQYSVFDTLGTITAMFFACVPAFWLGLMLILIFALKLRWFPSNGLDTWKHFVLPAFTQAIPQSARTMRLTRTNMLETIRQDYVVTAYAKGASYRMIIFKHCLRNALIPLITVVGVNFGGLLSGSIITESVFGMSGIGNLLVSSIRSVDVPSVMACTLLFSVMFSLINLLMDIIYAYVDPRIKAQYQG